MWWANTYDLLLYEFAQNLVTERLAAFEANQQQEKEEEEGQEEGVVAVKQRKRKAELQCQAPINDPHWRNWGQDEKKPNNDSYLYIIPQCMNADYNIVDLKAELW